MLGTLEITSIHLGTVSGLILIDGEGRGDAVIVLCTKDVQFLICHLQVSIAMLDTDNGVYVYKRVSSNDFCSDQLKSMIKHQHVRKHRWGYLSL